MISSKDFSANHYATIRKVAGSRPDEVNFFLNLSKPFGRTRPQFTQPLTEMSIRNIKIIMFLGSKVRLVRRADNFTAIYEPIV
jgi:hypothetical protein